MDETTRGFLNEYIKTKKELRGVGLGHFCSPGNASPDLPSLLVPLVQEYVDDNGLDPAAQAEDSRKGQQITQLIQKLNMDFGPKIMVAAERLRNKEEEPRASLDLNPLFKQRDVTRKDG